MDISVRRVLKALSEGRVVGILADQTAPMESVSVEFFGRMVPTFEGPAVFSLKTGAPIVMACALRISEGKYSVEFQEIQTDDLKGFSDENVETLTQRHVSLTEEIIRKNPDQWMWMHKRWKHVPDRIKVVRAL